MNAGLDRARDELAAAQLLIDNNLFAQATNCAFQAARHAAEAALLVLGEARSQPAQVVPAVVQLLVRDRALDPRAGRLLRSLSNRARFAEHSYDPLPPPEATRAAKDATVVVELLTAWLREQQPGPHDGPRRSGRPVRRRR